MLNDIFNELDVVFSNLDDLPRIGLSLALVILAGVISRWQRADLERDLAVATVRSFIQLVAIGYVLELIFDQESVLWTALLLGIMITIAARTSARRGRGTPAASAIAFVSISLGSVATLAVLVVFGVFEFKPQAIIPIGGMIIGNSMSVASMILDRMPVDLMENRVLIESRLALGATSRQASHPQFRRALRSAMIPHIDTTKTTGLIKLPGAMTGMILAGASPLEAVQLQIIVMYMIVGAVSFTGLIAAYLTYRAYFTSAHQLKSVAPPTAAS